MAKLTDYRLLVQIGAGRDGIAYRAETATGSPVEVRVLSGARASPERWPLVLRRLRMAALLRHRAVRPLQELGLEHDPPFIVLDWFESAPLAEMSRTLAPVRAVALLQPVAAALAAAHALGLVHGSLSPATLRIDAHDAIRLDFTDLHLEADSGKRDPTAQAPEWSPGCAPDPAHDVFSLGAVLAALFREPSAELTGERTVLSESVLKSAAHDTVLHGSAADLPSAMLCGPRPASDGAR